MALEVSLRAERCQLVLRVDRYAYPSVTSGSDANWLAGQVELIAGETGSYRARHRVALRTGELLAKIGLRRSSARLVRRPAEAVADVFVHPRMDLVEEQSFSG